MKSIYPKANTSMIELVGNTPYHLVLDPMYLGEDMTVYGKVTGVTKEYEPCGDGIIPVFEVSYWDVPFRRLIFVQYQWLGILILLMFPAFVVAVVRLILSCKRMR
ncbi:hypothetical protein LMP43_06460 [Clostridium botulinum]|nr:hypothetical protein [Clostridium botulinum]